MEWEMKVLRLYCEHVSIRLHLKDKLRLRLFLFDPRLELLLFGLRQWLIGLQLVILLSGVVSSIITSLILFLDLDCKAKDIPLFPYITLFLILLQLFIVLCILRVREAFNGCKK